MPSVEAIKEGSHGSELQDKLLKEDTLNVMS